MEVWKKIEGFENYEVSDLGRVKSLGRKTKFGCGYKIHKEIILKQWVDKKGYHYVDLIDERKRKKFLVHRLVAFHFLKNEENKPQINHIDGIKSNNNIHNLEWNTSKENLLHAVINGLNKKDGVYNYASTLKKEQIKEIRESNLKQHQLSIIYNVSQATISRIKLYKTYKNE